MALFRSVSASFSTTFCLSAAIKSFVFSASLYTFYICCTNLHMSYHFHMPYKFTHVVIILHMPYYFTFCHHEGGEGRLKYGHVVPLCIRHTILHMSYLINLHYVIPIYMRYEFACRTILHMLYHFTYVVVPIYILYHCAHVIPFYICRTNLHML